MGFSRAAGILQPLGDSCVQQSWAAPGLGVLAGSVVTSDAQQPDAQDDVRVLAFR